MKKEYTEKVVIVGSGVAGINAALTLVDGGYPGNLITIIDKGQDPYNRKEDELMLGFAGAGGFSDGKLTYHTEIGGQLSKYCGEEKAMELMKQCVDNFTRFHPNPEAIFLSNPKEEPDFIKPNFNLRLFPVWHIGSNYLHEIAKAWYQFLVDAGVKFEWETEVLDIEFDNYTVYYKSPTTKEGDVDSKYYDKLIFGTGKSGIDLAGKLVKDNMFETEPKASQIGVRFEAPQKYFQKIIDHSYDFKLYQKPNDKISLRTFCTNNNAAYVAVENTYGNVTYNGHAKKGEEFKNDMTNFGIIMEVKGIDSPFDFSRNLVRKCQIKTIDSEDLKEVYHNKEGRIEIPNDINIQNISGLYYSPKNTRDRGLTSEGEIVNSYPIDTLELFKNAFGEYADYITTFIDQMNEVFEFGDDWGMYIPEVKYLNDEVLVNYDNLTIPKHPNTYFVGDSLSARGITVSGAHGIYAAEDILMGSGGK